MLLGVCQVVILAVIASPFIPELAKTPSWSDNIYGFVIIIFLYLIAMRLLRTKL
jgi:hypothetical protein